VIGLTQRAVPVEAPACSNYWLLKIAGLPLMTTTEASIYQGQVIEMYKGAASCGITPFSSMLYSMKGGVVAHSS
jgi:hypothetical protein